MQVQTWTIEGQGFHFGRQGLGQEESAVVFSSDSLFAALISRLAERDGQQAVDDFIKPFKDNSPSFVITSCYPRAGQLRFYPPPSIPIPEMSTSVMKDLKRVKFISEGLFRRILSGESLIQVYQTAYTLRKEPVFISLKAPRSRSECNDRRWPSRKETVAVSLEESTRLLAALQINDFDKFWNVEKRPRVTLGREVQNSSIFFTGRTSFIDGCGLWFGIHWLTDSSDLKKLVGSLLEDLGDSGLGAERNVGFGACRIDSGEIIELPDANGRPWINLSRYLPREDEVSSLTQLYSNYQLEEVGGWLDSPARRGQRRIPVNMLVEGALLGPLNRRVPGKIEDVRPSYKTDPDPIGHAVYRSGLAFAVGVEGELA